MVNYIRLKQIKNSIKETGNTLMDKTNELTDLVKAQDGQMETKTTELMESFSTQSNLLEQKLEELGSLLNLVTLSLASDPLKEFGIRIEPPISSKKVAVGKSLAIGQKQDGIEEIIDAIASKINSIIEIIELNQQRVHGDLNTLLMNLEKLDSSLHQNEERMKKEFNKLFKSISSQSAATSEGSEAVPNIAVENNQWWWTKATALSSALCTVLTATVLVYEIFK